MSEGQHIEDYVSKAPKSFFKEKCLETVKEARKTFKASAPSAPLAPVPKLEIKPKVDNKFPAVKPETVLTVDSLNKFIEATFSGKLGDEKERTTRSDNETVGKAIKVFKKYNFGDYEIMESSASSFNCLIHSFLTSVSPAFRRLEQENKNIVAEWVRNYVLPATKEYQTAFNDNTVQSGEGGENGGETVGEETKFRLFGFRRKDGSIKKYSNYLSDTDIGKIAIIYNINILIFEQQDGIQTIKLTTTLNPVPESPVFMFMNASGGHFESVRDTKGSYTIPLSIANNINTFVNGSMMIDSVGAMKNIKGIQTALAPYQIPVNTIKSPENAKKNVAAKIGEIEKSMLKPVPAKKAGPGVMATAAKPVPLAKPPPKKVPNSKKSIPFEEWFGSNAPNAAEARGLLSAGVPIENIEHSYKQKKKKGGAYSQTRSAKHRKNWRKTRKV